MKKTIILAFILISMVAFVSESDYISGKIENNYIGKIKDSDFKSQIGNSNFGKAFGNNNYRGAIPTPEDIKLLKEKYGVKVIISLIPKSQISKKLQLAIKENGMDWIVVPVSKYPPKKSDWDKILKALKKGNVFVHCKHGADRTGAIIARAWIEIQGKDPDKAYQDMLNYNAKVEKIKVYKDSFKYLKKFIYNGI